MAVIKAWRCTKDPAHVLGYVMKNGRGIHRLLLLREAQPTPGPSLKGGEDIEVMAVVEGYVADVRCSICGGMRTWVPGEEAMEKLMESWRKAQVGK